MRTLLAMALVAVMGISANAQNKNAKYDLHVKGNCGQCKERIEKAAYSVKGVKMADWNEETQNLHIILNETKNNVAAVEDAIVAVGHDTNEKRADDKVYAALHSCCLYDRDEQDDVDKNQAPMKNETHENHSH